MKSLSTLSALIAGSTLAAAQSASNNSLVPLVFKPLPLGSISPSGWLRDQMQLMADGLAGHEHDFYQFVAHSSWLGGDQEYSGLNEGFPYWFNGLVPLAYGLNDSRLIGQVTSAAQTVFDRQADDGWLGPENVTSRNFWARYPFFLGLTQLAEADSSWTDKVVSHLQTFNTLMDSMMRDNYTGYQYHDGDTLGSGDFDWGQVRSADMVLTLQWMYENHPGNQSQLLLDNMKYFHDGGKNWEDWYTQESYLDRGFDKDLNTLPDSLTSPNYAYEHGVNVGQGLKAPAVYRRWNHDDSFIQIAMNGVNWTMEYHGAASGTVLADERLVGLAPYSGSELCTAVEAMFSLSYLYQALGTNYYADRAELTAFNALPVMLTPDWWAHQYMAQPNQPYAENLTATPFYNTNSWGQTFGLEPNYPCCTVNHPQGWPKFASASYVQAGDNGLAHALLSPGKATANLKSGQVTVDCTTAYPFLDTLQYTITAASPFDFYVRVPQWATSNSTITLGTSQPSPLTPDPSTGMHKLSIPQGTTTLTYTLTSEITTTPRENDTIAIYKGALLYALEIPSSNTSTSPPKFPDGNSQHPAGYAPAQSKDYEYHNESAWNFAVDPSTLSYHGPDGGDSATYELQNPIFAEGATPGWIEVKGCTIDWGLYKGSTPDYPPAKEGRKCTGEARTLRLVPYASAKTHMAELATISL
ncbi:hypothetical protein M409DRAFT_26706 [Zasmidium cellare ATCC 36951]|uniref:Glycoside hydrolase family 127 protein n=1 Tax=Zasmidium cellare ATCC 36951 TaxID=1080233 RepID=A0A6A6C728_ZASCE|nr:uncharacterized protein M409DRAFT_26706 [Zasmidium cellare ATCC 36951]KAF2162851.1 hypothetical protein M409DRAFT_26706 [Zasmidium cellare ATCC 36951]